MSRRCDQGKTQYAAHAQATKAAILMAWRRWEKRSASRTLAHRVYACPFGAHWHVTSQAKRGAVKPPPVHMHPILARPTMPPLADALYGIRNQSKEQA